MNREIKTKTQNNKKKEESIMMYTWTTDRIDKIIAENKKAIEQINASWTSRDRYRISFYEFLKLPIAEIIKYWA